MLEKVILCGILEKSFDITHKDFGLNPLCGRKPWALVTKGGLDCVNQIVVLAPKDFILHD